MIVVDNSSEVYSLPNNFCLNKTMTLTFLNLKKTNRGLNCRICNIDFYIRFHKSISLYIVRHIRYKCKVHSVCGHSFCLSRQKMEIRK